MDVKYPAGSGGGGGGSGTALTHAVNQVAHGFTVGQAVRYTGTAYVLAKADAAANADVDGIVSAVADANNFTVQIGGYVTGLTGLTAGADYFLSASTAGALTVTEPTGVGQVSKPLLHADSTTSGYLLNMRGLVIPPAAVTYVLVKLVDDSTSVTVGEGKFGFTIPSDLNGLKLSNVRAMVTVAPTGTGLSFGVRKGASTEMLSTNVTIDTTKTTSDQSATQPVINAANATVGTGDVIWIDCDQADSNGASRGSMVRLGFS